MVQRLIERGRIYNFVLNLDGHHIDCDKYRRLREDQKKPHNFIIISNTGYNNESNTLLAIPLTSEKNKFCNRFGVGEKLEAEDFEGPTRLDDSVVRFDCVCRIDKDHIQGGMNKRVTGPALIKIVTWTNKFMMKNSDV
jgi:hypothetical protein